MAAIKPISQRQRLDWWLLTLILLLIAYGLVVLYSAGGPAMVKRQLVRLALGLTVLVVISQFKPERFEAFAPWVYLGSLLLLVAVLLIGVESKGAQRWLNLGISVQPSELAKITVPLMLAWLFRAQPLPPDWRALFKAVLLIGAPLALIVVQPDLGTSLLVAASGGFVIFLSGLSWKAIGGVLALLAVSAPVVWHFLYPYQKQRILMFLNPESDPLNSGWNIIQSKIAIGSGGLFGKGWQQGTQTQLDFLPEHSTDFILSVLSEEFGFAGVLALFSLYILILLRCFEVARNARSTFTRLTAGALALTFFVYVFINAGMISGILPVVGVPLPLVSYGGTSIITLLASFGIIMSIQTHKRLIQQ